MVVYPTYKMYFEQVQHQEWGKFQREELSINRKLGSEIYNNPVGDCLDGSAGTAWSGTVTSSSPTLGMEPT